MSAFDPYHKWLGIPKDQRPPTLFQLLGISPDETDTEVIEEAAIRQTSHVRTFQIGPHGEDCTRVLNELAVARQTLLNPDKRKAYKEALAKQAGKKAAPPATASAPPAPEWDFDCPAPTPAIGKPIKPDASAHRRPAPAGAPGKKSFFAANKSMLIAAGTCGGGLIVAVIALLLFRPAQRDNKSNTQIADAPKVQTTIGSERKSDVPVKQKDPTVNDSAKKPEPKKQDSPKLETPQKPVTLGTLPSPKLLSQKIGLDAGYLLAPDGSRVFGKHGTSAIAERPVPSWEPLKTYEVRDAERVRIMCGFSPDSHRLAFITVNGNSNQYRIWDYNLNKEMARVDIPNNVSHIAYGNRGFTVFIRSQPGSDPAAPSATTIITFDLETAKELKRWTVYDKIGKFPGAMISPDRKSLVVYTAFGTTLLDLDVRTGKEVVRTLPEPLADPSFFSSRMLFALTSGGYFRQIMLHPFHISFKVKLEAREFAEVSVSPDDRYAIVGAIEQGPEESSTRVVMIDMNDGGVLSATDPFPGKVTKLYLAQDGIAMVLDSSSVYRIYQFALPPDSDAAKNALAKNSVPFVRLTRAPLPDPQAITAAEMTIRAQHKKDYAKKVPADTAALAEKLLQLGIDTADDQTTRYVLYNEARELAVKAGQPALAMKITGHLKDAFDVDATALKMAALTGLGKTATGANAVQLADMGMEMATENAGRDDYQEAVAILAAVQPAALRAKDQALLSQFQRFDKQVKEASKEFEEVKKANAKLEQDPDDVKASVTVGQFLAFRKGDWEKGLNLLAKSHSEFEPPAKNDLANPEAANAKLEVADAWWKLADKKSGSLKAALQWRAGYWYRSALAELTGAAKDKIVDRLKRIDEQPSPFVAASAVGEVQRFTHKLPVTWMTVAPDGKRAYSSTMDGLIREWDLASGSSNEILSTPLPVSNFALSPDEKYVAVASSSGLSVWELAGRKPLPQLESDKDVVPGVTWYNSFNLAFLTKNMYYMWNHKSGLTNRTPLALADVTVARQLVIAPSWKSCVMLLEDGRSALTKLVAPGAAFPPREFVRFDAYAGVFSRDGDSFFVGGKDAAIRLYSVSNLDRYVAFQGHTGAIRSLAVSPDGKRLVSGSDDKTVRIWDIATATLLQTYALHTGPIRVVAFTNDGRQALSASMDGTIRVWSLPK